MVGITLYNLATLQNRRGHLEAAKTSYENALAIFRTALSPRHPTLVRCLANYRALGADRLA
jgi:hypothetical protein